MGSLQAKDNDLGEVIAALGGIIATLNYDTLLEKVMKRVPVAWNERENVEAVLRGQTIETGGQELQGVLHLHGYWSDPTSVVLGLRSYDRVKDDPHARAVLQLFTLGHTLVFIGCKGTLEDPNFTRLTEWVNQARGDTTARHFIIHHRAEEEDMRAFLREHARWLTPICYGPDHTSMAEFLRSLLPHVPAPKTTSASSKTGPAAVGPFAGLPFLVDGPSFLDGVLKLGIYPTHIVRQFRLSQLRDLVALKLPGIPIRGQQGDFIEFFCDDAITPPLSNSQQCQILAYMKTETGVYVDTVDSSGVSQDAIRNAIMERLRGLVGRVTSVVLVSSDPGYAAIIRRFRHDLRVFLLPMAGKPPVELENEVYSTFSIGPDYLTLFEYRYPRFQVDDLNETSLAELFSEADDRNYNQLCVDHGGDVYFTSRHERADTGVRFRFEGFHPYNGWAGPKAASDASYINRYLNDIKLAWAHGVTGYIDYPVAEVITASQSRRHQVIRNPSPRTKEGPVDVLSSEDPDEVGSAALSGSWILLSRTPRELHLNGGGKIVAGRGPNFFSAELTYWQQLSSDKNRTFAEFKKRFAGKGKVYTRVDGRPDLSPDDLVSACKLPESSLYFWCEAVRLDGLWAQNPEGDRVRALVIEGVKNARLLDPVTRVHVGALYDLAVASGYVGGAVARAIEDEVSRMSVPG